MFRIVLAALLTCGVCVAESRRMILVTPKGVWEAVVTDGVPGPLLPIDADVVVQGFDGAPTPPKPEPPPSDPIVQQVATVSKSLGNKEQAVACSSMVDMLSRNGLTGADFTQALTMAAKIADTSLNAGGKVTAWATKVVAITDDAAKIKAGVDSAWSLSASDLLAIQHALENPESTPTGAALDFAGIIAIIRMVIELLKELGII